MSGGVRRRTETLRAGEVEVMKCDFRLRHLAKPSRMILSRKRKTAHVFGLVRLLPKISGYSLPMPRGPTFGLGSERGRASASSD